jgi:uncharacterized iron-regulated membrane protein
VGLVNRDSRKLLYDVHGWAGFVVGIALLIVSLSGAVAVFAPEIDRWSNPTLQADPDASIRIDPDQAVVRLDRFAALAAAAGREVSIELPNHNLPGRYGIIYPTGQQGYDYAYLDAATGKLLPSRRNHVYYFLRHLHVRLLYNRLPVGIVGLAMLLSIATGLLIYRHILRDMFRIRWRRSGNVRVTFADFHKLVGFWALLFHIVIATTGTWLALESYLQPVIAAVANQKPDPADKNEARADVVGEAVTRLAPLAPMVARSRTAIDDFEPTYVTLEDDAGRPHVRVSGDVPGLVQQGVSHVLFDRATGRLLEVNDVRAKPFWTQFRYALEPIHYGYFGGFWVKLLYLVVGLLPAALSITGTLLWFERRRHENRADTATATAKAAA